MSGARAAILCWAVLVSTACGHGAVPEVAPDRLYVTGAVTSAERPWVLRFDGDVDQRYPLNLLPGGPQQVILTGLRSGEDQGSLVVLDAHGRELMRHRAARDTNRGHNLLAPIGISGEPYVHQGRRLIAIALGGLWSPYGMEILEVADTGPRPELIPRYRFWNPGSVSTPVFGDGLVAFRCLNNSYRDGGKDESTPVGVCVLSLDDALRTARVGGSGDGTGPVNGQESGRGFLRYFIVSEREGYGDPSSLSVSVAGGCAHARLDSGLSYVLDPTNGAVRMNASEAFRDRHERRRRGGGALAPIDEHLETLRSSVRVFPPVAR